MGHSISEIARQLRFSRSTVSRVYQEQMDGGQKTSDRLNDGASLTVSKQTVQRLLHRMDFRRHRPTRVPLLNARHRAARLTWVREHRDWSVED
ncbi:HTH_Tnp_Tc3_2 domain-containing protein [Trichonephila clavipes]|nr:HTH_Tnp_Tc3_2 domain-containing protein [Trichonephila clavipes]